MPSIPYGSRHMNAHLHRVDSRGAYHLDRYYKENPQDAFRKHSRARVGIDISCDFACSLNLFHLVNRPRQMEEYKNLSSHYFSIEIVHLEITKDGETELSSDTMEIEAWNELSSYDHHIVTPIQRTAKSGEGFFRWVVSSFATNLRGNQYKDDYIFEHHYYATREYSEVKNSPHTCRHIHELLQSVRLFRNEAKGAYLEPKSAPARVEERNDQPRGRRLESNRLMVRRDQRARSKSPVRGYNMPLPRMHRRDDALPTMRRISASGHNSASSYEDHDMGTFMGNTMAQSAAYVRPAPIIPKKDERGPGEPSQRSHRIDVSYEAMEASPHQRRVQSSTPAEVMPSPLGIVSFPAANRRITESEEGEVTAATRSLVPLGASVGLDMESVDIEQMMKEVNQTTKRIEQLTAKKLYYRLARKLEECETLEAQVQQEEQLRLERQRAKEATKTILPDTSSTSIVYTTAEGESQDVVVL